MDLSARKFTPPVSVQTACAQRRPSPGETVRVEILSDDLRRLLENHMICAADLHCLDCASKQCLHKLCLKVCAKQLRHDYESCHRRHSPHEPENA